MRPLHRLGGDRAAGLQARAIANASLSAGSLAMERARPLPVGMTSPSGAPGLGT